MKRIQQKLLSLFFSLTNSDYRKIKKSGIFDPEFYLESNPDVAKENKHPLVHYFREGWREGRSPHLLFDIGYYFKQIDDEIKERQIEPILHFITEGWLKGKKPSPYFDPLYYVNTNKDFDFSKLNPLSHFILRGCRDNKNLLHPYLNLQFYAQKYPDVVSSGMDPLKHYIKIGRKEKRQPGVFFDVSWYLDRTPILHELANNILLHHNTHGIKEGKSPVPVFDPAFFMATYAGKLNAEEDLLLQYLAIGEKSDLRPSVWFDPAFYRQNYLGGVSTTSCLGHYLSEGVYHGNYPNRDVAALPEKPVISIIIPVYNVKSHHLNNCIRSVLYQSYPHWQLCLADDCSTFPHVRPLLEEWAAKDSRINVTFLERNLGIAGATNAAAGLATGDYLGFLDNDDELSSECLYKIVKTIQQTGADLLYTDEDLIGEDGRRFSCFYKPDYNPELLLCHNYITHFVVTKKALFREIGGFSAERAGAQDYDLFLKLSEKSEKIVHLAEILYHWRASETSTSINHDQKDYADEAGRQSLVDAIARRNIEGEVLPTELKFYYRTRRDLYLLPLVSVIVYWDQQDQESTSWLSRLISITAYANYEIILLHDEECNTALLQTYLASIDQPVKLIEVIEHQGIAVLYNLALQYCDGDYVAFISSDVVVDDGMWLSTLLEYCQSTSTGIVFGGLTGTHPELPEIFPFPDIRNESPWYYARYLQQASVLLNGPHCPQNTWGAIWECCVIQKEALDQCGGFAAEDFPDLFALHDLSFQFHQRGLKIYYTPYCQADWRGDARRFVENGRYDAWNTEKHVFQEKWRTTLRSGDPFFNKGVLREEQIPLEEFENWYVGCVPEAFTTM